MAKTQPDMLLFCRTSEDTCASVSMGTETAGTEVNFCLFFCSHDFPFLSLFSDSPSIPHNEYSKWRILGTRGEMRAVLGISIKRKELVNVLMIFQLHLLYLSAGQWGKQRGDEQGYVQFTPWNTSTDWVELVSFLLHPTFSALEWTFHTSSEGQSRAAWAARGWERRREEIQAANQVSSSEKRALRCRLQKTNQTVLREDFPTCFEKKGGAVPPKGTSLKCSLMLYF